MPAATGHRCGTCGRDTVRCDKNGRPNPSGLYRICPAALEEIKPGQARAHKGKLIEEDRDAMEARRQSRRAMDAAFPSLFDV